MLSGTTSVRFRPLTVFRIIPCHFTLHISDDAKLPPAICHSPACPVARADDQCWSINFVADNLFSGRLRIAALVFIKQDQEENREVMMKNKIAKIITVFFILILLYLFVQYIKPAVFIKNETDNVVYIYTLQSEDGREPTPEELERWKGSIKLQPQQQVKISVLAENLFTDKRIRFSNGWYMGLAETRTNYNTQGFIVDSTQGHCEIYISIHQTDFTLSNGTKGFCYKKLRPVSTQYGENE